MGDSKPPALDAFASRPDRSTTLPAASVQQPEAQAAGRHSMDAQHHRKHHVSHRPHRSHHTNTREALSAHANSAYSPLSDLFVFSPARTMAGGLRDLGNRNSAPPSSVPEPTLKLPRRKKLGEDVNTEQVAGTDAKLKSVDWSEVRKEQKLNEEREK